MRNTVRILLGLGFAATVIGGLRETPSGSIWAYLTILAGGTGLILLSCWKRP
jgi:hypothetical protein